MVFPDFAKTKVLFRTLHWMPAYASAIHRKSEYAVERYERSVLMSPSTIQHTQNEQHVIPVNALSVISNMLQIIMQCYKCLQAN